MADVVDLARKRLAALEVEAEQLRQFLRLADDMAAALASEKAVDKSSLHPDIKPANAEPTATPAEVVEAAKAAIREKGQPMTRSQLVLTLTGQGMRLAGGDPRKNLGTVLWRSSQFDHVEGLGYWPKDAGRYVGIVKRGAQSPRLPLDT
jgi:hypothetical protein